MTEKNDKQTIKNDKRQYEGQRTAKNDNTNDINNKKKTALRTT